MRTTFLPFSRPSISEADIEAVAAVMRSGWITTGPKAAEFEAAFCSYAGSAGAVALASGTAGMHVVLTALGIGPGDEVITPSMTWVSTINLITLMGATPVFADVDQDTLMVTAGTVAPCITARTRAIVPVHFAGAALDLEPLRQLAASRGIPLIEDAAHAVGTEYQGARIGRRGTAIFSFHPIKDFTTGEGGMVVSDDAALLARVRRLKFHGLEADAHDRTVQGRAPLAEVQEPGFKYNLTDMAAALGLGQLARLDSFIGKRTMLARRYLEQLADVPEISPLGLPGYSMRHAWHLFIVRVCANRNSLDRDAFMAALRQRNIGTGLHFKAAHTHRFYRESLHPAPRLPATEWNSERICSLPLFPDMQPGDVDAVVAAIREILA